MSDHQPRWLDARAAAAYLSLDKDAFLRQVKRGALPPGAYHLGARLGRWDREALDSALNSTPASKPRHIVTQAVHDILSKGRTGRAAQAGGRVYGRVPLSGMGQQAKG